MENYVFDTEFVENRSFSKIDQNAELGNENYI